MHYQMNENAIIIKADNPAYPEELTLQFADIHCMFKVMKIVDSPEEEKLM